MPLMKSASPKAFSKNISTEMRAGKPQKQSIAIAYAMKRKAQKKAMGGELRSGFVSHPEPGPERIAPTPHNPHDEYESASSCPHCGGEMVMEHQIAEEDHESAAEAQREDNDNEIVDRIMSKKYSEGGVVANEGEDELDHLADSAPNEFDDLVLDDQLTADYKDENKSDAQEDADRRDIVAKIMKKRKDRNPRPA